MSDSEPNNIGRLAGEPGTVLFFFGLQEEYLRSFGNNFLTGLSKLDSSFRKEFFEEICTFWKRNILHECFGTPMEKIEILYSFFGSVVKLETYFCERASGGKIVFSKEITVSMFTFDF